MASTKANITIVDVAKAAGVSVSTVSRVLNNKDDVSPQTYARVREVIDELGYTSSLAARSMRSRNTRVIGVLVIDLSESYNLEVLRGIGDALHSLEYDVIVYSSGRSGAETNSAWERGHAAQLSSIADGVIVVTPTTLDIPGRVPLVVLDPCEGEHAFPSVISQNYEGACEAMEYLLSIGHRRIGHIAGWPRLLSSRQRQQAYEDALIAADIAIDPALIETGDYTRSTANRCAQRLLALPEPPTAIFAANDQSALGVLDAARDAGRNVPRDLSIVGFDNIPQTSQSSPPLTTVDQSIFEMASQATSMLVELIMGRALSDESVTVPARLVIRDSCQAPRQPVPA